MRSIPIRPEVTLNLEIYVSGDKHDCVTFNEVILGWVISQLGVNNYIFNSFQIRANIVLESFCQRVSGHLIRCAGVGHDYRFISQETQLQPVQGRLSSQERRL